MTYQDIRAARFLARPNRFIARVELDGRQMGALTVALSPTEVSDGGGYHALWGGEREEGNAA